MSSSEAASEDGAGSDKTVAAALKGVEVERIVGPAKEDFIKLGSLWQDGPAVVHFLRRFGCRMCRGGALEMSQAIPHLMKAGVRVAAIGPDPLGLEEFVEGKYWAGELYVDDGRRAYRALELKSLSYFQLFHQFMFHAGVKKSLDKTRNVAGNFVGDGMQLGATFVFDKGGKLLLGFRQETPADHPTPQELLEVFKIDPSVLGSTDGVCTDVICESKDCA